MGVKYNPKRDRHIDAAKAAASKIGAEALAPEILFGGASNDDLDLYTADMLALTAAHARKELARWDGGKPQVSVETVPGVAPGGTDVSIIAVTERNMPFLYDSVMGEVTSTHRDIHLAIHPILVMEPGKPIKPFDPDEESDPAHRVSHIQIHLNKLAPLEARSLSKRIAEVLEQVHQAVHDWPAMTALLNQAMQELEDYNASRKKSDRDEALAFLRWLRDNNFTFLGMREYTYSGKGEKAKVERGKGRGLGLLSNPDVRVLRQGKDAVLTTPEILAFLEGPEFLIVTKANVKSVVHRRAYMDYIGIKRFDASGNVVGELRIVGLFTSTAYTRQASEIPLLRHKIEKIIDYFGYDPQSHSGKMLANTLESYPRDDLFQIDVGLLAAFCEQINELSDRPRIRVLPRIDHFDRFVSILVFVPREQYDSDVREKIGNYLKTAYDGRVSAYYPAFPEGGLARVHFIIGRYAGKTPRVPQAKLEEAVRSIVTRWTDRFNLLARKDGVEISVGEAYQAAFTPAEAYDDLHDIAACKADDPIRISFYHKQKERPDTLELKIFHAEDPVSLSRRVPLLENLGFRVISEQTYDIGVSSHTEEQRHVVLHDMELVHRDGHALNLAKTGPALEEAFLAAWNGTTEDDTFNRLILLAGLTAREVTVLRAYARYLRQAGITYSQGYIADTLNKYPAIAADIFRLFATRMDPKTEVKARTKKSNALLSAIEEALSAVPSLDEDQILRRYVNVIQSTLRTNYFQRDADGKPRAVLAFKLDPKQLDGLPEPRPFREIFVYGTEVEGVHLRFGKVARGGLRWSDRAQDYRTEVLGLVKAQQVKNAVIVPVGAKGGFYPKQLPIGGTRDEIFKAGTEAYKTYIRTLLSVTDNIVGQDVVPPADTLRLDGDDPYFVVAADKGTATFSDTANGLAQEADFWLDDAFASGGSAGYDHKKMGITARGAWETVKRHFREMDIDIQTTPFTVAGVGDMSGDVFGNGMLLSEKIRLIAAFDHRDIFIDPNPDTDLSFAERKRMFALPRSSWQDYDRKTLSQGAMIISRAEKSVTLTPEAVAAIGIDKQKATPFEIMNAILKSQVDLLWFGGIGTYVRGSNETDAEVGDRANDAIRVAAEEVRARVIGEGANLGVTQKGRIGFSLAGGRCNSDAIDNSAGVNSSDVEVNIKIALASAMRDGRLTRPKRNTLLASMTDEVGHLVLRNNYQQSLAISLTEMQGLANRTSLARLMARLEADGHLNRKVETLPTELAMSERYQAGKPLTRPEIGVLLSYAKLVLFEELIVGDLPDDPYFTATLERYFPAKMRKTYAGDIRGHRLRREIIATVLGNETINRGGPAFVSTLTDSTGFLSGDVVKAAVLALDGFELQRIYGEIDALDNKVGGRVQNALYQEVGRIFALVTEKALRTGAARGPVSDAVSRLRDGLQKLRGTMRTAISGESAEEARLKAATFIESGVPAKLAEEIAELSLMTLVPEIMQISTETKETLSRTAQGYFTVTGNLRINRLLAAADRVPATEQFEAMALSRAVADIGAARRDITVAALVEQKGERNPVLAWQDNDRERVSRVDDQLKLLTEKGETTLAKITVAAGLLNDLARAKAK
ncbi:MULTISPECIES: NAD-glutamate dehydrogenase [unclassified Sinorhizobium]|uniref:NAD-glutamate dehydrogenase n=1 Tax=unclassified Sinorhizobium TaxID=2613772 RepID=UPI0024C436D2|nr:MULTISPECIES: NAD-glutamate dehydrogenase [unclassified Sinorhizobium]MDK1375988.1 NAD-glutamate dehydrogenase [Sinorhizobium sp. 6-70]MDK1477242.1 NAD-glutamate dehydrogenase [Sinorhizobium sp. 6-117]